MADLFLNFKDFDHHSSDDKTTTLQHKKLGHKLVLAHGALSDKHRKALEDFRKAKAPEQMAKGGEAKKPEETLNYKDLMQQKKAMNTAEANKPIMPKKKMADGGLADEKEHVSGININENEPGYTKMAVGGMPAAADPFGAGLPCLNPHCKSHGRPHPNCRCYGPGGPAAEEHAEGGTVGSKTSYCAYGFPHHAGCEYAKGGEVSQQGDAVREAKKHQQMGNSGAAQQQMVEAKDEAKGRAAEERHIKPNIKGLAEGGPVKMADGDMVAPQPPDADTSMAPAQTAPYAPMHTPMQTDTPTPTTKSLAQQELEEDHKYAADLDAGHITPQTYQSMFNNQDTVGKIGTLFGLMASGMGSGLTHQPNAVLQMMDNTINRDIDAQKTSAHNKMTHWGMNYQHALMQAQAAGMDANTAYTKELAKSAADTRTKMQADRNVLKILSDQIKNMPEGPEKQQKANTLAYLIQKTDPAHVGMAQQADSYNQVINDKYGITPGSSLHNPAPEALQNQAPEAIRAPDGEGAANTPNTAGLSADQSKALTNYFQPEKAETKKETPVIHHILSPDSPRIYKNIQAGLHPIWSKNPDIQPQYNQALQMEKVLNGPRNDGIGGIHDIMSQMKEAQGNMGVYGHLHSAGENIAEHLPLVGGAARSSLGLMPDTHSEKRFKALQSTLETDLSTALQGLMTPTDIHAIVSKYAPAYQDTDEDVKWKEDQMISVFKKALKTGALSGAGMLSKKP